MWAAVILIGVCYGCAITTFVNSSYFNFHQLYLQNFEEKNYSVFSRTTRGKRIQQSRLVFQTNISQTINELGEADLRTILMTF